MADERLRSGRLMYGSMEASEANAEAALTQRHPPPKSLAQAFAPYLAELVGTFVLAFTVGCCALAPANPKWSAAAIGFMLMVMLYATGPVSGGNLNPAVSLCLGMTGSLPWTVVVGYWVAQLAGGVAAGGCCCPLFAPRAASLGPVAPFAWEYAFFVEMIYTFMLCLTVVNCCASRRNNPKNDPNQFAALAIGFVAVAGGYTASGVSGASFNPAISLALDILASGRARGWGPVYAAAELLGAAAAALAFRALRPEEGRPAFELAGYSPLLGTRCFAEFIGTFVLVLTVGLCVTLQSPSTALAAGAALASMVYALGTVSGAHFNPAVTLAVVLGGRGRCSPGDGVAYVLTQATAGALAGLTYAQFHAAGPHSEVAFGMRPGEGRKLVVAGVVELFYTFVLAYTVLACMTVPPPGWKTSQNAYFGLAIGASVTAGSVAVSSVSGGELNPAVSFGMFFANLYHPGSGPPPPFLNCFTLASCEFVGGALAAAVFWRTHPGVFRSASTLGK